MMKKRIITVFFACVIIVLSYFYANIDFNSYLYNRNAETGTFYGTGALEENEIVTQTFVAEEDSIDGINIKVAVFGNVENVLLQCRILDGNKQEMAVTQVKAIELEANKFNKIEFPTITETKGKEFTLVLTAENADDLNGVGFYIEPSIYDMQQLSIKDCESEGTLVARIISHRFDVETFIVLLGIIVFVSMFMKILYKIFK